MIIGGSKKEVIENIRKNCSTKELNKKVETHDPTLNEEELNAALKKYYRIRKNKYYYFWESRFAYLYLDMLGISFNKNVLIEGLENIKDINGGAIITSNHFNPLDSMPIRYLIKKRYQKNLYIVIQDTNLAMPGFLGYLMNSLNTIPLLKSPNYMISTFKPTLKKILHENNYVLIYPEEEMWFNYRLPRPCKRGAYQFAAEAGVPVISCFVEMIDQKEEDNEEFSKLKYIVHVLKPIYPDPNKSSRENSKIMSEMDYKQKIEAYENAYHKKLNYKFSYSDIAGYKKKD